MLSITLHKISKAFPRQPIFTDLSLLLDLKGATILGENGAGKTVFLQLLAGIIAPDQGSITYHYEDLVFSPTQDSFGRSLIGFQSDSLAFWPNYTVYEALYTQYFLATTQKPAKIELEGVLQQFHLEEVRTKKIKILSAGFARRLNVALAFCHQPKIVLLDEPSNTLDPLEYDLLLKTLLAYKEQGTALFLTTHRLEEAQALNQRLLILHQGQFRFDGLPPANIKEVYHAIHQ